MVNGRKIGEGVYVIVLVIFTVYMLLDTFVITKKLAVVSNQSRSVSSSSDSSVSNSSGKSGSVTKSSTAYEDDNIKIALIDYRAESVNAILAINGDYYGAQESGYVIRSGVIYRETAKSGNEDLVIYGDGSFEIIDEDDITAEELLEKGAQNVLAFGPALVEDGSVSVTEDEEVGKAMASNPRTAIGIIDGRTSDNEGLSLYELAEFMESLGVQTAYNLDGGGSSTMYFNGQIINKPTTNGSSIKERSVSDIVYIGY